MAAVHRILRYLKRAPGQDRVFCMCHGNLNEEATVANWTGSRIGGLLFDIVLSLVEIRSHGRVLKQPVVARSSSKAEYRVWHIDVVSYGSWGSSKNL